MACVQPVSISKHLFSSLSCWEYNSGQPEKKEKQIPAWTKKRKKNTRPEQPRHSQKAKGHIFNTSYNNPDDIMSKMFKTNRGKEGGGWLCNIYPSAVCSLQCWKERRTPHGVNMSPKIHPSILHSVYPPSSWHSCNQMVKLSLGICPKKVQLHPRVGVKRRRGSGTNPYFFF